MIIFKSHGFVPSTILCRFSLKTISSFIGIMFLSFINILFVCFLSPPWSICAILRTDSVFTHDFFLINVVFIIPVIVSTYSTIIPTSFQLSFIHSTEGPPFNTLISSAPSIPYYLHLQHFLSTFVIINLISTSTITAIFSSPSSSPRHPPQPSFLHHSPADFVIARRARRCVTSTPFHINFHLDESGIYIILKLLSPSKNRCPVKQNN